MAALKSNITHTAYRSVFIVFSRSFENRRCSGPRVLLLVLSRSCRGFLRVFGFHKSLQIGQTALPEAPVLPQPGIARLQRFRIQTVETKPPFPPLLDQM